MQFHLIPDYQIMISDLNITRCDKNLRPNYLLVGHTRRRKRKITTNIIFFLLFDDSLLDSFDYLLSLRFVKFSNLSLTIRDKSKE